MATKYMEEAEVRKEQPPFVSEAGPYLRALVKRTAWGAIFAGVTVALVAELAFTLLGMGVGVNMLAPATAENPFGAAGTGAGLYMMIITALSLFAGGWVAGRLLTLPHKINGALHGAVVWGLVSLISFFAMTSAMGMLVSGSAGIVGRGFFAAMMAGAPAMAEAAKETVAAAPLAALPKASALWAFVAVVFSGAAAAWGGMMGCPKSLPVSKEEGILSA